MNPSQARRCVLYARLSVTKEESVSIARQLQSCRRYAEARGWKIVGEFIDDGVSATASRPEDRKGWASLLAARDFDAVVIWKVDRLARRVLDFLHADETLQKRGAGLVAVEDPIDMTSPQGRAFAVMLAVFGEMEAEAIRARVRAARAQLLKDGRLARRRHSVRLPLDRKPGRPWPGTGQGPRARPVAFRGGQDGACTETPSTRSRDGSPTAARRFPAVRPCEKTEGGAWNRQTVDRLLRNPSWQG